jgi:O-antigen ligase
VGQADQGEGPTQGHSSFAGLDWFILALLLSGLASTLIAAEQGVAWREFRIVFLFGALFYWLITRIPWPAGRSFSWRPLVGGLLAGLALASMIGLWQLVTGQGRVDVEGVWRVRALYGSPNNLALVLDRGVPLALALAAFGALTPTPRPSRRARGGEALTPTPLPSRRARGVSVVGRVGLGVAGGLMLLACVATFSKGALLLGLPAGLAVILLGGAWRSGRRWPLWALAGLVAVAAAGFALLFRTPRFADLFNFETGTSFLRVKLWRGAWQMALDHPILGVGPDNFLYAYRTRYVLPSAWEELNLSHPHSIVLDLWTRLGLVGLITGGWALVAVFRAAWRAFRRTANDLWPLALGLLAGLAATVTHGLIDNSLFLPDLIGLFVIGAGLLRRLEEDERRDWIHSASI